MLGDDVHAPRPRVCPGCKVNWLEGPSFGDPYGDPYLYEIDDTNDGWNKFFLKGWECDEVIFGTMVAWKDMETGNLVMSPPKNHDWVILKHIGKRKVYNHGRY